MASLKNIIRIFFDRNYSKILLAIFLITIILTPIIYIILPKFINFYFVIVAMTIVVTLRNDLYWSLFRLGYKVEVRLKKIIEKLGIEIRKESVDKDYVGDLVRTVFGLAQGKTGALITIERNHSLKDYLKSGSIIDANINKELLESIFNTDSPLHDGAVIISNERIRAAGCFFPITSRSEIAKKMGSRHRAALGLSEITDALTILVSEERGTIHIVFEGNISKAINDKNELKELILDRLE